MKVLENRTLDNKMELEILDALDEIRSLNAKTSKLDPEEVLQKLQEDWKRKEVEKAALIEDEEERKALDALTEYVFISDAHSSCYSLLPLLWFFVLIPFPLKCGWML